MVFGGGWPPHVLDIMPLDEFCDWYAQAVKENDALRKAMGRD